MENQKQKVLIVVGPTSSGKSALAVGLARKFNGEVISADSRQVYKGLNIGTGKITEREMKGVQHHLLDEVSPHSLFTAHDFLERARRVIEKIAARGKLPIVAGGTGFYIDALAGRVVLPNVPANKKLRENLEKKTLERLFELLREKDPARAKTIDPHNKHRLVRALEIVRALGKVPNDNGSEKNSGFVNPYIDALWIGIALPFTQLEKQIKTRLRTRMKQGMVREARRLHREGLSYARMEQLGLEYRALARFLRKEITREQMIAELDRDIRRYAKRQRTYWKRNPKIRWFDSPHDSAIVSSIKRWVK